MKIEPEAFSEIIHDQRISHGAFRVWHLLLNMTGANRKCYPSIRTIATKLGSDKNSIMAWLIELEAAMYLRIERGNKHRSNQYYVTRSLSYSALHRVGNIQTPGVGQNQTQLSPLLNSKNSGQGGASSKEQPLALPESKKKALRPPKALLDSLVSQMRAATGNPP